MNESFMNQFINNMNDYKSKRDKERTDVFFSTLKQSFMEMSDEFVTDRYRRDKHENLKLYKMKSGNYEIHDINKNILGTFKDIKEAKVEYIIFVQSM